MTIYTTMDSPLGDLLLAGEANGSGGVALTAVRFAEAARAVAPGWTADPAAFTDAIRQLTEYFAAERTTFDLDRAETAATDFQRRVWAAVDAVGFGETVSYGQLATRIGAPHDRVRAVGAAIGANPLLIVRPCHRVVGADGSLTGYAGGLERKRQLLIAEGTLQPQLI
jgi:methylated-DNA-[protein]-cysteine S-methyltransferase